MTTVQPFSSWVVVTVRPRRPELVELDAVAYPRPPELTLELEETLVAAADPPLADAEAAYARRGL